MPSDTRDSPIIRLHNCRVVQFHESLSGGFVAPNEDELWIRNGMIIDSQRTFFLEQRRPDENIDCYGAIVAPGLVDLQVNGGWGVDFSSMDNPEEGLRIVAKNLLKYGVTSFCPTIVSSTPKAYREMLPYLGPRAGNAQLGAAVLGAHLEGPFISKSKIGCHDHLNVCQPIDGRNSILAMYGGDSLLSNARIVTIAPELSGAVAAIEFLAKRDILVSLGHSSASIDDGEKGVRAGAKFVTHLFNAMLPFHHREPGLIGLLAMENKTDEKTDEVDKQTLMHFGIIADGIHVHPAALRVANRMAPTSLCLVSDQVVATGLPDGKHHFPGLGRSIQVNGRKAFLADQPETLAGAVTLLDECVRTFKHETGCSIDYSLAAASKHPAAALRILDKGQCGTLGVGAVADFILVDPNDYSVRATYLAGECVFTKH